jgi:hypothetical protein
MMRIVKYLTATALTVALAAPFTAHAQENSLGTYSPYTMYGVGNLNRSTGSTFFGMGGASIGFRNDFNDGKKENSGFDSPVDTRINVSNPAALSGLAPRSFTFDFGMAGSNSYLSERGATGLVRTSFNTFNFNNITLAFPLAKKLGFAINVSPYSEVGYRIHTDDKTQLADLGVVRYYYNGQGEVNEAKMALGWEPLNNLSVGAELSYLWGNIDRTYTAQIVPYTGTGTYNSVSANTNESVGRLVVGFGAQYSPLVTRRSRLTLGATYRPGVKLNSTVTDHIPSNNIYGDDVRLNEYRSATHLPQRIALGAYFHRAKWAVGADWIYEGWAENNAPDPANDMKYANVNTFKLGARYTPNRYDIRGKFGSFFNRITYKAGVRLGNDYLEFKGRSLDQRAVSMGLDIPFKAMNVSTLSLGVEYGERGTTQQNLVKERYFKVNVGIMFFGRDYDYWFEKYRYN